jgi:hypothetical protein
MTHHGIIVSVEPRTHITTARLFLKATGRTERKLVFNRESGELLLLKQRDVRECVGDIVIDQIFNAEDHF